MAYTLHSIVYTGATNDRDDGGLGAKVVRALMEPLNRKSHHVIMEYSSTPYIGLTLKNMATIH